MNPSNPANGNPNIIEIMDANGIKHQVAAVNHTHSQSEVTGLTEALEGKAAVNHTHTGISSTNASVTTTVDGQVVIEGSVIYLSAYENGDGDEVGITPSNIGNLARALRDPDSTPTADSDNLVTSCGVKAALDGKAAASHTHTVSQISDFNSAVTTKVNAGVADAIRGVAIKDVEITANTTYDIDDHMADMKGRQALILLTNADPQEDSIYKYIISGTGIDISFDDSNRKLANGVTYLISIIYIENETTYHNGQYFVSVLSTFS